MKERYYSLDVFRGATVAFMILVNNQMGESYAPLDHAPWHGLTPTDLVFPFFLFAVGNALSFVMPRLRQLPAGVVVGKILRRSALIFLIGFVLNWSPFLRWSHDALVLKGWTWVNDAGVEAGVRVMGVLARIALCYLFGALIIYFSGRRGEAAGVRGALGVSVLLLLGYWGLCYWQGKTTGAGGDPYSLAGYFGTAVDIRLFGASHLYHGEGVAFDPEGVPSTMAAIVQVIVGYITGWFIQTRGKNAAMLGRLLLAGVGLLVVGYCWSLVFPLNKKIWTSAFVVVSSGYAILMLTLLIYVIEFRQWRGWAGRFFDVFGKNPLFIFVLSGLVPRVLGLIRIAMPRAATVGNAGAAIGGAGAVANAGPIYRSPLGWFFEMVCKPLVAGDVKGASLLYAVILVLLYWVVGYVLDRRKIYVRV